MKKVIIGFTGDDGVGRRTAANVLSKCGFHKVSVNSKVKEFAKHLFPDIDLSEHPEIVEQVRKRGCSVHKEYWLNLILVSVSNSKDFIVFDDISPSDNLKDKIKLYHIYRPGFSKSDQDGIEKIDNDGTKIDFIQKIESLSKSIKKTRS